MNYECRRRDFLKIGVSAAMSTGLAATRLAALSDPPFATDSQDNVPDTLELSERAGFSVNALTNAADARFGWESDQTTHLDQRPPYLNWRAGGPCLQKPVHALPMMRIMSGSTQNADVDKKMVGAITDNINGDGLWWLKVDGHSWREGVFESDQVWPVAQGRLMEALLDWHKYDHDPGWLKLVESLAAGLEKIALRYENRAWYYTAYTRAGWREHVNPFADHGQSPAKSMVVASTGGSVGDAREEPLTRPFFDIGLPLHGLAYWYEVSGDPRALALSRQLANFMLKPSMWVSEECPTMVLAAQRGVWSGHFHTHTMGLMGLLKYAVATNDYSLKEFVASSYNYSRNFGLPDIGFFPAVIAPLQKTRAAAASYGGPGATGQCDEGCAVADMTWLAVRLSNAGVGDYWDHVDQYVRNHLGEHQLLRRDYLEEVIAAGPEHQIDPRFQAQRSIAACIGTFASGSDPTMSYAWATMCCNANCAVAMYEAWSSILRATGDIIQVNLLLNRRSRWLDLDSYLPYEGKVVLKNRTAREVQVRIPGWANKRDVTCHVNQKRTQLHWLNTYLVVEGLMPGDMVTIECPVTDRTQKYSEPSYGVEYTCRFRGNTLVDISPREQVPHYTRMASDDGEIVAVRKGYPLYQRQAYRAEKAPIKQVRRYVADALI
jgi:hypothetical protein